jgi:hypothetical protein
MQLPNSGTFQKKPPTVASNNGRIDESSACVRNDHSLKGDYISDDICRTIRVQCHHFGNFLIAQTYLKNVITAVHLPYISGSQLLLHIVCYYLKKDRHQFHDPYIP